MKKAAATYLQKSIQTGKHGALEDAKTTMELYLLFRNDWESNDEPFLLPPNQIRQVTNGAEAEEVENSLAASSPQQSSDYGVVDGGENNIGLEDLEKFPDLSLK